ERVVVANDAAGNGSHAGRLELPGPAREKAIGRSIGCHEAWIARADDEEIAVEDPVVDAAGDAHRRFVRVDNMQRVAMRRRGRRGWVMTAKLLSRTCILKGATNDRHDPTSGVYCTHQRSIADGDRTRTTAMEGGLYDATG